MHEEVEYIYPPGTFLTAAGNEPFQEGNDGGPECIFAHILLLPGLQFSIKRKSRRSNPGMKPPKWVTG